MVIYGHSMKKIQFILISILLVSCDKISDALSDGEGDVLEYSIGKPASYVIHNPDGTTNIHQFKWDGNNLSRYRDNDLYYEAKFDDYGYALEYQYYKPDGSKAEKRVYERSKFRVLNQKIFDPSGNLVRKDSSVWSNDSLEVKVYDTFKGVLLFKETFDKANRFLSMEDYDTTGNIILEYEWKWDTDYRKRILERSRNGNIDSECTWVDYLSYYTRFDPAGNILWTSTREVNEFDDQLITTYESESIPSYQGRITIWTWKAERFKPYYTE